MKAYATKILQWSERYTRTDMLYATKGSFWLLLWKGTGTIASLLLLMLFARFTEKEVYGGYSYVLATTSIIALLAIPGLTSAVVRAVALGKEGAFLQAARIKFKWSLLSSAVFLSFSLWYWLHADLKLGISFLVAALLFPFFDTFLLYLHFWHGKKRFDIQSKLSVLSRIASATILAVAIVFSNRVEIIIAAYFIGNALVEGILFFWSRSKVQRREESHDLTSQGIHLTLLRSVPFFLQNLDKVALWHFAGPVAVALYSFAQLPIQRLYEVLPVEFLAFPKLSERAGKIEKKPLLRKVLLFLLLLLPIVLFMVLAAPFLYRIFFPSYGDSVPVFQALAAMLFFAPFLLFELALVADLKTKDLYITKAATLLTFFAALGILVPLFGIWGAVAALFASKAVDSALLSLFFLKP